MNRGDAGDRSPPYRRSRRAIERRRDDEAGRAIRDGDRGRRPGRPFGRLPPEARGPVVRDPRRERPDRRQLARALGFAEALLARIARQPPRHAVPRATHCLSDERRDGGLPRGVRGSVRAARANGDLRGGLVQGRQPLPGERPRGRVRSGQRRRRDGCLPEAVRAPFRLRARSEHHSAPLERLSQSLAAAGWSRARRRREPLGLGRRVRGIGRA